jgi:hypothetical protein
MALKEFSTVSRHQKLNLINGQRYSGMDKLSTVNREVLLAMARKPRHCQL